MKDRSLGVQGGVRLMYCATKEVILKTVVQALPTYSMSCFKLMKGLCKKLHSYPNTGGLDRWTGKVCIGSHG